MRFVGTSGRAAAGFKWVVSLLRLATVACALAPALALASPRWIVSGVTKHREHVGQCFSTRIRRVESRLVDGDGRPVPNSGSAIELADGHYNVGYEQLPAIDSGQRGDRVRLCVIALPTNCPKGDARGIVYRGRNQRTGLTWKATDAEHMCGGA